MGERGRVLVILRGERPKGISSDKKLTLHSPPVSGDRLSESTGHLSPKASRGGYLKVGSGLLP